MSLVNKVDQLHKYFPPDTFQDFYPKATANMDLFFFNQEYKVSLYTATKFPDTNIC